MKLMVTLFTIAIIKTLFIGLHHPIYTIRTKPNQPINEMIC
jgi:hypothetical protein